MDEESVTPARNGGATDGVEDRPGSQSRAGFVGTGRPTPSLIKHNGSSPGSSAVEVAGPAVATAAASGIMENDKKRKGILNKWISSREPTPFPRIRSASESVVGFQRGNPIPNTRGDERSGEIGNASGNNVQAGATMSGIDRRSYSTSAVPTSEGGSNLLYGPFPPLVGGTNSPPPIPLSSPHQGSSSMRRAILGSKGKERMNITDTFDLLFKKKPKAESTPLLPTVPSFVLHNTSSVPYLPPFPPSPMSHNGYDMPFSAHESGDGIPVLENHVRGRSNSLPARSRSASCPIPADGESSTSQELALDDLICKDVYETMMGTGINSSKSALKTKVFFGNAHEDQMAFFRIIINRAFIKSVGCDRGLLLPLHNAKEFNDNSILWKIRHLDALTDRYKRDSFNLGRRSTSDSHVQSFSGELGEGQLYEVGERMFHPETGIPMRERRFKSKIYHKCFTGSDAVDWMMSNLPIKSRREGVELGKRLMAANYFTFIDAEGAQPFKDRKIFFCLRDDFGSTQKAAVGRLFVKLISAEDFTKKIGMMSCLTVPSRFSDCVVTGANNYYCELSLGLQKTSSSSFAKPEWNEECEFSVWSDSLDNTLKVELWMIAESMSPQRLAKVVVENISSYTEPRTSAFKFKRGGVQSLLGSERGHINLSLHYIPNNDISAFKKLESLLCSDFLLVRSIFSSMQGRARLQTERSFSNDRQDSGDIASALIHIFNQNELLLGLLRYMIHMEVENTVTESLLFREESLASRMISVFIKLIGRPFVYKHLQPLLTQVLVPEYDMEINPRVVSPVELAVNQTRLLTTAQQFFDSTIGSLNELHYAFREVSRCLFEAVSKRFPDSKYKVLGSFFFLRWLCPSLVTPDAYGLIDQKLDSKSRRRLVLIAKVIQNLANEVYFEQKEEYMKCSNVFIDSNLEKMHSFFDSLVERDEETEMETGGRYVSIAPATRAHLEAVYYYLQQNYGSISNEIRRTESEPTLPTIDELEPRRSETQGSMMSVLDEVLKELQELSKKNPTGARPAQL